MSKQRQERDASVAFIGAARNAKIASEAAISESETNAIARELEGAHEEALAIKHARAQQGAAPIAPVQVRARFAVGSSTWEPRQPLQVPGLDGRMH